MADSLIRKFYFSLIVFSMMFAACDSGSGAGADYNVDAYSELPKCNEELEGQTGYASGVSTLYTCKEGKWQEVFTPVNDPANNEGSSFNGSNSGSAGDLRDSRDGKTYRTTVIGNQVWMAENLNFKMEGSDCFDENKSNCEKYGRLYTWQAAKKACPSGWHLPNDTEWRTLFEAVGGMGVACKNLKSTSDWEEDLNGTDSYGFSILPAGQRRGPFFSDLRCSATFWSSTEYNSKNAYQWHFTSFDDDLSYDSYPKFSGFSVRCLRN